MTALPRSKGTRPVFLGSELADDMLAMLMAVIQELAVLRERCDTAERLLVATGVLGPDEIDSFTPTSDVDTEREAWRRDYLDRVLYALKARAEEQSTGETRETYHEIVDEIGKIRL